jgi:hypothetical protein
LVARRPAFVSGGSILQRRQDPANEEDPPQFGPKQSINGLQIAGVPAPQMLATV